MTWVLTGRTVGGLLRLATAVTGPCAGLLAVPGIAARGLLATWPLVSTLSLVATLSLLAIARLLGGWLLAEPAGLRSTGLLAVPPWGSGSAAGCSHRFHSFAYAAGWRLSLHIFGAEFLGAEFSRTGIAPRCGSACWVCPGRARGRAQE